MSSGGKPRIIVIDDSRELLDMIEMTLASDYEVISYSNPIDAMTEHAFTPEPKAVIVDLMMPGASGLVVLHWLKAHYPEVRRIVLTAIGYPQPEAQELSHVYLDKPTGVDLATLYDAIEGSDA